jgi:hypothetical protein
MQPPEDLDLKVQSPYYATKQSTPERPVGAFLELKDKLQKNATMQNGNAFK